MSPSRVSNVGGYTVLIDQNLSYMSGYLAATLTYISKKRESS